MVKHVLSRISKKIRDKQYVKELYKRDVQLNTPFVILYKENLLLGRDIYIGPGSWLILRGKLTIKDGVNRSTSQSSYFQS